MGFRNSQRRVECYPALIRALPLHSVRSCLAATKRKPGADIESLCVDLLLIH
jgi:hypothetical protein